MSARGPSTPAATVTGRRVRVMLVDDHELIRRSIAELLAGCSDIEVIAEAADGSDAVDIAHAVHPDVIVMDIAMPRMTGVEATRRIMHDLPDTRIIGLSMRDRDYMADAMLDAGAAAYLNKGSASDLLLGAIRTAAGPV